MISVNCMSDCIFVAGNVKKAEEAHSPPRTAAQAREINYHQKFHLPDIAAEGISEWIMQSGIR
jgi:hypothetical protein